MGAGGGGRVAEYGRSRSRFWRKRGGSVGCDHATVRSVGTVGVVARRNLAGAGFVRFRSGSLDQALSGSLDFVRFRRDETWPELSRTLRCALRPAVAPGSDVVCGSRLGSACGVSPPTWYSLLEGATRCANFALQGACDGAVGPMLGKDSHPWGIGVLN